MKGLLYKEFYLSKKTYLLFMGLTLMMGLLGALICLSMVSGNLQPMAEDDPTMLSVYTTLFTYLPFTLSLISVVGINHSIYDDYTSKWMVYSYTLPVKAKKAIGARYLAGIIVFAFCLLYGIFHGWILSCITKISLTFSMFQNMVVILILATFIFSLLLPMGLKYKTANKVSARCVFVGVTLYFVSMALFLKKYGDDAGDIALEQDMKYLLKLYRTIRSILIPLAPFIILAILGCSLLISIRIYERREK